MVWKLPWAQEQMFWAFGKTIFQFFAKFWVAKLKPFSGKARQSAKIYLNQNLGIRTLLENNFWTNVELKNECCEPLKRAFFSFLQLFERRSWNHFLGKWSNVLKSIQIKFGHQNLLRKWFWSNLEHKDECCNVLKRVFFSFLQIFEW